MLERPVIMKDQEVTITAVLETATSFGVTEEGLEVFIPAHLIREFAPSVSDTFIMDMVVQTNHKTDYRATAVHRAVSDGTEDASDEEVSAYEKELMQELARSGIVTAGVLASQLDMDTMNARTSLEMLYARGHIVRIMVDKRYGDAACFYCTSWEQAMTVGYSEVD